MVDEFLAATRICLRPESLRAKLAQSHLAELRAGATGSGAQEVPSRFLIRDRDGKFPALFDTVLADAGLQVVLSGVRIPQMNAIMERRIQSCRHELVDRTLIWNHQHLLHVLWEYEQSYDVHRPHQGIANARPLHPLPPPITNQAQIIDLDIRRRQRLGGILNDYHHTA